MRPDRQTFAPTLLLAATLLTACQSPPAPFAVRETFPVSYSGTLTVAQAVGANAAAAPTSLALHTGDTMPGALTVRATMLELPSDDVHSLLPGWGDVRDGAYGARIPRREIAERIAANRDDYQLLAAPVLLVDHERRGSVRTAKHIAYVSRIDYHSGRRQTAFADPVVDQFEVGFELIVTPRRDGDNTTVTMEWLDRDRVQPRPVGLLQGGRLGGIELPLILDQRITAELSVHSTSASAGDDAILLGSMLTAEAGRARLLFVEFELQAPPAQ
jgi:hypothetical protein